MSAVSELASDVGTSAALPGSGDAASLLLLAPP